MPLALILLAALAADPIAVAVPKRDKPVSYGIEISDILDSHCTACHNAISPRGGLRLDSVAAMVRGGKNGPALAPGKAADSLLFRVAAHQAKPFMSPPDKAENPPLAPEQLGVLKLWIDAGAHDDSEEVAAESARQKLELRPNAAARPIFALDMTGDGRRLAVGSGADVRVFDADSGLEIVCLPGQGDFTHSVRFRGDGAMLAAGSYQNVSLWAAPTGQEVSLPRISPGTTHAAVFLDGGSRVALIGGDRTARLIELRDGGKSINWLIEPSDVVAASPDGQTFAVGGSSGMIRLLFADQTPFQTLPGPGGAIKSLTFMGKDRLAAVDAEGKGSITILAAEKQPIVTLFGPVGPVPCLGASGLPLVLVSGGEDGVIRTWSGEDGHALEVIRPQLGPIRSLAVAKSGRIVAGLRDGRAAVIEAGDRTRIRVLDDLRSPVTAVAVSADETRIATATARGAVKIWDAATARGVIAYQPHDGHAAILTVAFARDGDVLAASAEGRLSRFATRGNWSEPRLLGSHRDRVLALDFSPDRGKLAAGGGDPSRSGEVQVWDVATATLAKSLPENLHSDVVFGVRFHPDGKRIATASADKFVKITEVVTGKVVHSFEGHTHHALGVDWDDSGKFLLSGGADGAVKLWNSDTGDSARTLEIAGPQVSAVRGAKIRAARVAVYALGDGKVRIRGLDNGSAIRTLNGPNDYLYAVAPSPDGRRISAGGADGTVFFWDAESGKLLWKQGPGPDGWEFTAVSD